MSSIPSHSTWVQGLRFGLLGVLVSSAALLVGVLEDNSGQAVFSAVWLGLMLVFVGACFYLGRRPG